MSKYLVGAIGGLIGILALKVAYNKGRNDGVDECKKYLQLTIDIQESVKTEES